MISEVEGRNHMSIDVCLLTELMPIYCGFIILSCIKITTVFRKKNTCHAQTQDVGEFPSALPYRWLQITCLTKRRRCHKMSAWFWFRDVGLQKLSLRHFLPQLLSQSFLTPRIPMPVK